MSRRKDRERFEAMKRLNPDYQGFRGYEVEPTSPGAAPLQAMVCTVCGRKRNVPVGVALDPQAPFVCQQCRDEGKG